MQKPSALPFTNIIHSHSHYAPKKEEMKQRKEQWKCQCMSYQLVKRVRDRLHAGSQVSGHIIINLIANVDIENKETKEQISS